MSKTTSALLLSFLLSAQGAEADANEICPKVVPPSIHIQYTNDAPSVRVETGYSATPLDERGVSKALERIRDPHTPTPSGNYPIGCEEAAYSNALRKIQGYEEGHNIPLDAPRLEAY